MKKIEKIEKSDNRIKSIFFILKCKTLKMFHTCFTG